MTSKRTAAASACVLALLLLNASGVTARARRQQPDPAAGEPVRPTNINSLPFTQLAEKGRMMAEAGRLGLETELDLVATAELNEDGSFKPETATIEWRKAGDEDVVELAQQFVTAISHSRILSVLRDHAKSVRLTARLDRQNLTLGLEAEGTSEAKASQLATGYDTLIRVARKTKEGTTEGTLFEALKVTSDGKVFRLGFEMPKEAVAKMVAEMLDKRAARHAASPNQD